MKSAILFSLFMLIMLSIAFAAKPVKTPTVTYLAPAEFKEQISQKKLLNLVDIRTPEEYAAGHIGGSTLINLHDASFASNIGKLKRSVPIYIYSRSGHRTEAGREELQKQKFETIIILKGGINAWNADGLPIEGAHHE